MAVLQMLAARPGEVVARQEFIEAVWATEYGGDESLTRAVSQLRKIFGMFIYLCFIVFCFVFVSFVE